MKPVSPAAKDVSLKILAVVLAIAIWAVAITDKQTASPDSKIEVVVQAPVALKNIPDDLLVTEPPAAVTVRLRGPRGLESAALESTAAVVDLEKAGPGENLFPVEVVPPDGFEMVRMSRAAVDLSLERRVAISCPVKVGLVTAPHLDLELGQDLAGALHFFSGDEASDGAHPTPDTLAADGVAAGQDVAEEESGLIEPSDDLLVTEPPAAVTVRLRGPRGLESAALESTAAVVDLEKAGPGENLFPVEVVPPDGFEMVRMSRAAVDLSLERRVAISCPVKVGLVTAPHLDLELGQDLAGALHFFSGDEASDGAHPTPDTLAADGVAAGQDVAEEESGLIEPSDVDVGPAASQVSSLSGEPNSGGPRRVDLPNLSVSISVLPGEVSVAGADSVVSKVASVVALVIVGPESSMVAPVLTLDVHGEPVPDVTVYPDTVTVSITY
jgi:YbbR domain-containing protein